MAKVVAPLLSFGARGQIGGSMVFGTWKGRAYARQLVTPGNPQTAEQTLTRNSFTWLQAVYKIAPSLVTDAWQAYAKGLVMTDRNAFTKVNNPILRTAVDLDPMTMSPGALGGLPPATVVATPGADSISVAITPPATLPQGWTVLKAVAAAIVDQDPQSGVLYTITAGSDLTDPYTIVLAGLDEVLHQVFGWLVWTRPDGAFAFSPSVQTSATPT